MPRITFHGAARTVTGSKYLVEAAGESVLIDCGMFQGEKRLRLMNWEAPAFDPTRVGAVILTHTHIDHIGYLPRLVDQGFNGRVFATPATRDLAKIMLEDAGGIHEEDARFLKRHHYSKHEDPQPFFTRESARRAWAKVVAAPRDTWHKVSPVFSFRYHGAGHLLGAASIELLITEDKKETRMLFSGDLGRYDVPFCLPPEPAVECDYLVMESTYGNRPHTHIDVYKCLTEVVDLAVKDKSVLLIPSFAVGRSQQLIYMLRKLEITKKIPCLPIHVDSPMAMDATGVYCKFEHDHGIPMSELQGEHCVLRGPQVHFARSREQSMDLNTLHGPAIIIASGGMLTGGRALHHFVRRAPEPENIILFVGFQVHGTRGRQILDGANTVRIFKESVPVEAQVMELDGLSGHGDVNDLLRWSSSIKTKPKTVFLTHGELEAAEALKGRLENARKWNVAIPELGESVELT